MKRTLLLLTLVTLPVWSAEPTKPTGTLIDFRVDVQKSVANDLGRATAYAETNGADPADVAHKLKTIIGDGLAIAKAQPGIVVKSGATHTYPIYAKNGRNIESWRMRSELLLESRDAAALSAAVGKLQGSTLAVSNLNFSPAAETRRQVEDEAALEAIEAFRAKAARLAAAMKKSYRIVRMNIGSSGQTPQPMYRAAAMQAEAAPMPIEAGESNIGVNISGQIELTE